ncbi:MAG: hypothetical protein VCE91_00260, partial [Nitrospinota bacterium]
FKRYVKVIVFFGLTFVGVFVIFASTTLAANMNDRCRQAVKVEIGKRKSHSFHLRLESNTTLAEINGLFSPVIDGCIVTIIAKIQIRWKILDLYNVFLRPSPYLDLPGALFFCDRDGVDNVLIHRVREYDGRMWNVHYGKYLDDGKGGLPRTLKAPPKPFSRKACRKAFENKITELTTKK